ncbi:hypothetical protein HY493_00460 [Candidatus Woesearchaeota archaeon]|nr:hypothetical protein [Candidatus Woesearchaeota archaeon]
MDKTDYILIGVLVLVLAGLAYAAAGWFWPGSASPSVNVAAPSVSAAGSRTIGSGSTDQGDVSIELTPLGFKDGRFLVTIAANTHSVDLSPFDLSEITTLTYDGRAIKPVAAPSLSGHHASGTLEFDTGKEPSKFTITITGIPAVSERVFDW